MGLYAVVAHSVAQRTREIGVRMAIGATATQIWRRVLRQGMAPVVLIIVGLLACRIPARRAMREDPVAALRRD